MTDLVDTKVQDLKQGDVFYGVDWKGSFVGPYIVLYFCVAQRTRKLPRYAEIHIPYYDQSIVSVVAFSFSTKRNEHFAISTNFKVDPTAEILIQGIAV